MIHAFKINYSTRELAKNTSILEKGYSQFGTRYFTKAQEVGSDKWGIPF